MNTKTGHVLLSYDFFPKIGGAHTWMYEVYKRFPEPVRVLAQDYASHGGLGEAQRVFDAKDHGAIRVKRVDAGIDDINLLRSSTWRHIRYMTGQLKRVTKQQPCTFHSLRTFPEGIAAAAYKTWTRPKCRMVTYVHGEELNVAATSRQLRFLAQRALSCSDLVIVNSRATQEKTKAFCRGLKSIAVIHPGVDTKAYALAPSRTGAFRDRWAIGRESPVLITMARLEPRKNHLTVLKALARLKQKGIAPTYIIGSRGEQENLLKAMANDLGLSDQVVFTGYLSQEEKITAFLAADIHIMPSIQHGPMVEGFGIVFIEAAAAGIPSIAGISGGQAEAVRHNETGLVVDGRCPDEVAGAIEQLISSESLRKEMGCAARRWAHEHDWNHVVQKTVNALKTLNP